MAEHDFLVEPPTRSRIFGPSTQLVNRLLMFRVFGSFQVECLACLCMHVGIWELSRNNAGLVSEGTLHR